MSFNSFAIMDKKSLSNRQIRKIADRFYFVHFALCFTPKNTASSRFCDRGLYLEQLLA